MAPFNALGDTFRKFMIFAKRIKKYDPSIGGRLTNLASHESVRISSSGGGRKTERVLHYGSQNTFCFAGVLLLALAED